MIAADDFIEPALERGFGFYTGVPCSFLTPFINRASAHPRLDYVAAASEGEAVAIAAGAWLAGRQTVVMCQNSGLGNTVNPLTSLNFPFRIPTLLIVTWRGQPSIKDEPQHELMGQITGALLDTIRIEHRVFPTEAKDVQDAIEFTIQSMDRRQLPAALIMAKDSVRDDGLSTAPPPLRPSGAYRDRREHGRLPGRYDLLEALLAAIPDAAAVIATTGKCGRELFTLADRPQHLYQVGSMGCASGMGLGVAMNATRPVVVLDGDGAALMKLGSLATIGAYAPRNLIHVVLDNGVHDSTGGQATVSSSVDFARIALSCGYAGADSVDTAAGFRDALAEALGGDGPRLLHARIAPGSIAKLGRPTIAPPEVARRFKDFLASRAPGASNRPG
ncbi:MAG: phosphonopyruvate decarboxylase [Alphaproteobacteria bacterium]|nr:phosphonopyruvate decarboxylase [Alphaproteobacteria bacterium]